MPCQLLPQQPQWARILLCSPPRHDEAQSAEGEIWIPVDSCLGFHIWNEEQKCEHAIMLLCEVVTQGLQYKTWCHFPRCNRLITQLNISITSSSVCELHVLQFLVLWAKSGNIWVWIWYFQTLIPIIFREKCFNYSTSTCSYSHTPWYPSPCKNLTIESAETKFVWWGNACKTLML